MDFDFTPEEEAFRDEVRAFLKQHLPKKQTAEALAEWQKQVRAKRWVGFAWPEEVGGGGGTISQQVILKEEMAKAQGAPARHLLHGPRVGRALDPLVRQRGAEAALHPRHPRRQVPVVHRLLGAGLGQRPRGAPDARRARRRRLRRERPEDLDLDRDVVEVDHPARAHRSDHASRSTRASPACWCRWTRRASRCARSRTWRAARCSPRCSSTTCACRSRTGSARKGRAGRSRSRRSRTSARASPRWRASSAASRSSRSSRRRARRTAGRPAQDPGVRRRIARADARIEAMRLNGLRFLTKQLQGRAVGAETSVNKLQRATLEVELGELALEIEGAAGVLDQRGRARGGQVAAHGALLARGGDRRRHAEHPEEHHRRAHPRAAEGSVSAAEIEQRLRERLGAVHVEVEDESHLHAGHGAIGRALPRGRRLGALRRPLARGGAAPRLRALGEWMDGPIHALAVRTFTPEQWERERSTSGERPLITYPGGRPSVLEAEEGLHAPSLRHAPDPHLPPALDARGARRPLRAREDRLRERRHARARVPEDQPERPRAGARGRRPRALRVDGDQPLPGREVRQGDAVARLGEPIVLGPCSGRSG